MTAHEEHLCQLARVNIAYQGYRTGGNQYGFWPFTRWRVWASKDEITTYWATARHLTVALHRLMLQLPEFGP